MKSIIEEASSIIKAIEKGWASAGKPTEFTVKVLEQPAYNFLGFNTKPAKISFFFDDRTITASIEKQHRGESKKPQPRQQQAQPQSKQPQARTQRPERAQQPQHPETQTKERAAQPKRPERVNQPAKERTPQLSWNQEGVTMATDWVKQFLSTINKGNINFTTTIQNHILKIDFSGSITGNNQKELTLFKNAAHLLMSSLRNATNSELKQLKVVFSTQA